MTKDSEVPSGALAPPTAPLFTPGPWTTEEAPYRSWICSVGNNVDDPCIWTERQAQPGEDFVFGDKWADARLMAAAPDLLAVAKLFERSVLYEIRRSVRDGDDEGARLKTFTLGDVRAAIAKAEGRS